MTTEHQRVEDRLTQVERIEDRTGRTLLEGEVLRFNIALRDAAAALGKELLPLMNRLARPFARKKL